MVSIILLTWQIFLNTRKSQRMILMLYFDLCYFANNNSNNNNNKKRKQSKKNTLQSQLLLVPLCCTADVIDKILTKKRWLISYAKIIFKIYI